MNWKVPLMELQIDEEEMEAIQSVLRSGWIGMGPQTESFEAEFSEHMGFARRGVAVNSGTAALHTAMHALGIGWGDEVIVPSITFAATAASVRMAGAIPVFADSVSLNDFSIDPRDVERKISSRTKAIIVVHYGGFSVNMHALIQLGKAYGLPIVEDAAHGPFVKVSEDAQGMIGDIRCYSFHATKNMTTAEGGLLYSRDKDLLAKASLFRSHGIPVSTWSKHTGGSMSYDIEGYGMNYRMTDIAAALGRVQLSKQKKRQLIREELVRIYRNRFQEMSYIGLPYSHVLLSESSLHLMPVILGERCSRSRVLEELRGSGIQCTVHYPACHLFSYYRRMRGSSKGDCPIAEIISDRQLTLPLHAGLNEQAVHYVCDVLQGILEGEELV